MREKKRERDKRGKRRVWEKGGTQRVGEKERGKPSLKKGGLDGVSLVKPDVMKTLTLLYQNPVLGQDLTLF